MNAIQAQEHINDNLRIACFHALEALREIESPLDKDYIEELEFVLGSYEVDDNPEGLNHVGGKALLKLNAIHEGNKSLVDEQVIRKLHDALEDYSKLNNAAPVYQLVED